MCGLGCGRLEFEDSESWLTSSCRMRTVWLVGVLCGSCGWGTNATQNQTYFFLPPCSLTAPGSSRDHGRMTAHCASLLAIFHCRWRSPPFKKKSCCISLYFIKVVNICLVSGPLQANAFVSISSDSVLTQYFICTEELLRVLWLNREASDAPSEAHVLGRMKP